MMHDVIKLENSQPKEDISDIIDNLVAKDDQKLKNTTENREDIMSSE